MGRISLFLVAFLFTITSCNSCKTEPQKIETPQTIEAPEAETPVETPVETDIETENPESSQPADDEQTTTPTEIETKSEPETKTKKDVSKKVTKYSFLNEKGKFTTDMNNFDLANFAADEVALKSKGDCPENCGKKMLAVNYNNKKSIQITVNITAPNDLDLYKTYTLKPDESLQIGCTKDCTAQSEKVKYQIVSAKYLD